MAVNLIGTAFSKYGFQIASCIARLIPMVMQKIIAKLYPIERVAEGIEISEARNNKGYSIFLQRTGNDIDYLDLILSIKNRTYYKSITLQEVTLNLANVIEGHSTFKDIKENETVNINIRFFVSDSHSKRLIKNSNNFADTIKVYGTAHFYCDNRFVTKTIDYHARVL